VLANKVCPVVLRRVGSAVGIRAFEHPLAGCQLVKGTIEPNESIEVAALRELAEESGIDAAVVAQSLGIWSSGFEGQVWAFVECSPNQVCPESWGHQAPDDGGHAFRCFWHPLFGTADSSRWHSLFQGALHYIQKVT
jgi:8-oxo-dGTP pyrophosphatase MutT (NUDIX family)